MAHLVQDWEIACFSDVETIVNAMSSICCPNEQISAEGGIGQCTDKDLCKSAVIRKLLTSFVRTEMPSIIFQFQEMSIMTKSSNSGRADDNSLETNRKITATLARTRRTAATSLTSGNILRHILSPRTSSSPMDISATGSAG